MTLPLDDCIPAPGQGIIAIETRAGDASARLAVAAVNDAEAAAALDAERALVVALGGGCQMPIGGVAIPEGPSALELWAIVASLDGTRAIRYKKVGTKTNAVALGRHVAEYLLKAGADETLTESRIPNPEPRQVTYHKRPADYSIGTGPRAPGPISGPGIPAAIATPGYTGVPVTYPGGGDTVMFVRGHEDHSSVTAPEIDWNALAQLGGTVICYAGPRQLPEILKALTAHGFAKDESAAIV